MAKPRVTATDRLANVIEVVELGQRTGLLSVERGSGSVLEEGELYFISGRVTHASLAGLRGREALTALSRWGTCRFSFDREVAPPPPNIAAAPDTQPDVSRYSQPTMGSSQPGYGMPSPSGTSGIWPSQPPMESSQNGFGGPGFSNGYPTAYPQQSAAGGSGNYSSPSRMSPATGPATGYLNRRPRRAPDVRDLMAVVTTHNLSRSHRTILLLADGEHTVLDLARLSSKPVDEVSGLLTELEARGLVYYYNS